VTVSSSISQAYSFNIVGVGSNPAATAHSAAVNFTALPVQSFDFMLSATPPTVSVSAGRTALYSVDVSPTTGTFPGNVSFSGSTLPVLTTCAFNPTQVQSGVEARLSRSRSRRLLPFHGRLESWRQCSQWRYQSPQPSGWDDGSAIERLQQRNAAELRRSSSSCLALWPVSPAEAFRVTAGEAVESELLSELTTSL